MTTISTTQHQRTPLFAALAIGAALVVGGAVGVAIDQSSSEPTQSEAPATTTHTGLWGFDKYDYYHGPNAPFYDPNNHGNLQQNVRSFGRQLGL